jgi:nitrite reductase/ring-hydroxylating ferredoxin subunit
VPPDSSASERATYHGVANLSAVAMMSAVAATRRHGGRPRPWELATQIGAAGVMAFAGWLGGTLVYRNQIGVDHRYAGAGKWQERSLPADGEGSLGIEVGRAEDLDVDQIALLRIGDRRVVLARVEDGFVAFDDRCTHKGGPLSDGTLACGTVQCPWHGSQFNVRNGSVAHGPAEDPIRVHSVVEREGRLFLRFVD